MIEKEHLRWLVVSFAAFALAGCAGSDYWSNKNHLRNWEKLTLYGGRAQIEGQSVEAESCFRQAVQEAKNSDIITDFMLAGSENHLGEALLAQNKLAEAMKFFQKSLLLYENLSPVNKKNELFFRDYAECLAGLAEAKRRDKKFSESVGLYKKALAVLESAPLNLHVADSKSRCLAGLGQAYRQLGNASASRAAFNEALELLSDRGCPQLKTDILALSDTALSAKNEGLRNANVPESEDPDAAKRQEEWQEAWRSGQALEEKNERASMEAFLRSYEISKSFGAYDVRRDTSVTNIGIRYALRKQWPQALPYLIETVDLKKHRFGENDQAVVLPMNRLARAYIGMNQPARAEPICRKALAITNNAKEENPAIKIRILTTLAQSYRLQKNLPAALKTIDQANLYVNQCSEPATLNALYRECAFFLKAKGQYAQARNNLEKALDVAKHGLTYKEQLETQVELADLCFEQPDPQAAEEYYSQAEETISNMVEGHRFPRVIENMAHEFLPRHISLLEKSGKSKRIAALKLRFQNLARSASK